MTIYDTSCNRYYDTPIKCTMDIAKLINKEILDLQKYGCHYVQLDEPVFARYPDNALKYGSMLLEECFKNITIHKSIHICCGYPDKLEETDYQKADKNSYIRIAKMLDESVVDSVSMEDAHRHNDLSQLLPLFTKTIVILGVVKIATVQLEDVEQIRQRIKEALKYIDRNNLWISPDCGLGMLPVNIAIQKLSIISEAVKDV